MNDTAPAAGTISTAQAAKLLLMSEDWIRQLSRKGFIPKAARGRFNLVSLVQGYIRYRDDADRRTTKSASESRVQDARAAEIERRMAREDRKIVDLDEAMNTLEDIVGLVLATLGSLPAQITRNPSERQRIEGIVFQAQSRLAERCAQKMAVFQTGEDAAEPEIDE